MTLANSTDAKQANLVQVAGIDEAGRGPLAGPVVAACVVLNEDHLIEDLDDSKKLSEKKRARLFDEIVGKALGFGIGIVSSKQIDEMNILRASLFAMKLAFDDLLNKSQINVSSVLIDGNQRVPFDRAVNQTTVIGGDAIHPVIMAASIVAKVTRDRIMAQMANVYPGYSLAENKGYGTASHLLALRELGPSPIHRMSFAPVKQELMRREGNLFQFENQETSKYP